MIAFILGPRCVVNSKKEINEVGRTSNDLLFKRLNLTKTYQIFFLVIREVFLGLSFHIIGGDAISCHVNQVIL